MKNLLSLIFLATFSLSISGQSFDFVNAPVNPLGFKHKKEHFFLKGDIYASDGKIFDKNGNLIYNFGTRYYYDNSGRITGNNYDDEFEYDSRGNIIRYKYKSGSEYNYQFNTQNLLVYEKNTYGDEKTYKYDSKNRVTEMVYKKKGVLDQTRYYSYNKAGNTLIVTTQYIYADGKAGYTNKIHYRNGYTVKEELASDVYDYVVETDSKGNKSKFYTAGKENPRVFETFNRYYSDTNKPMNIEFGYYYMSSNLKKGKILPAVYINGKHAKDIEISKGMKPNEKVIYDGLTETYYSVPNVIEANHTIDTRIPVTKVLSKGLPYINYAYDGKFINYIHGQNRVKSREFSFIGPHMIDYRVDKSSGITYIIDNYKNIKHKEIKPIRVFTTDTASIVYNRNLENETFFIVVKGKHIDYKKARFEYLKNGDPVIFINDKPTYVLSGFDAAREGKVFKGKHYNNELNTATNNNTSTQITSTSNNTNPVNSSSSGYQCIEGDCKNGWGKIKLPESETESTFSNGSLNGVTYISYTNGGSYHGEYNDNRREGTGFYYWSSSGNTYIGQWKNGKQDGYGYVVDKYGSINSIGKYLNGELVKNLGTDYKANKVSGSCVGDCSNGFGKYTYSNGDIYIGFFNNSYRAHIGTYYWINNSTYTGAYSTNGKRNGYGKYTYVDTSVFKGYFVDDKIDGLGKMKYAKSGNVVNGVFNNNGAKVKDY
jgi:hypothetical protein